MDAVTALFNPRGKICRLYTNGWDNNLDAWTDEMSENFASICKHFEDDDTECRLHGEAKLVWIRNSSRSNIVRIELEQFAGARQVTMIRVHRKRGKK